jgi:hypothetical protein
MVARRTALDVIANDARLPAASRAEARQLLGHVPTGPDRQPAM